MSPPTPKQPFTASPLVISLEYLPVPTPHYHLPVVLPNSVVPSGTRFIAVSSQLHTHLPGSVASSLLESRAWSSPQTPGWPGRHAPTNRRRAHKRCGCKESGQKRFPEQPRRWLPPTARRRHLRPSQVACLSR